MKTKLLKKIRKYYTFKYNVLSVYDKAPMIYCLNHHLEEVAFSTKTTRGMMMLLSERFGLHYSYMDKVKERDSKNYYKTISKL